MSHNRKAIEPLVRRVEELLRPHCDHVAVAGSYRRGKPQVKDIEFVLIPRADNPRAWLNATDSLVYYGVVGKARYGVTGQKRWGDSYRGLDFDGVTVELFAANLSNFGNQFWLRTGPGNANQFVMSYCVRVNAPVRARDGYWWHGDHKLNIPDEETLFAVLGMSYIPPDLRSEETYRMYLNKAHRWPADYRQGYAEEQKQLSLF